MSMFKPKLVMNFIKPKLVITDITPEGHERKIMALAYPKPDNTTGIIKWCGSEKAYAFYPSKNRSTYWIRSMINQIDIALKDLNKSH